MRKGSVVLPEHILNKMDPKERKRLGNAGRTQMEISAKQYIQSERKIHDQFSALLRRYDLAFVHSDPTKKSSIVPGHPDYLVTRGNRCVYIEFKVAPNTLQKVQTDYINFLVNVNGSVVHVVTETAPGSALPWATAIIKEFFSISHD